MSHSALREYIGLLACPHCGEDFSIANRSIECPNRHSYDCAKSGYLNFLHKPVHNDYDKTLLNARRTAMKAGLYDPIFSEIAEILPSKGVLLDAGCGEGTALARICNSEQKGVGLDLSKDGISLAAKQYKQFFWAVGVYSRTPFKDGSFAGILNMLSPANYTEFRRILAPHGMLLKIVPEVGYLQELREIFYKNSPHELYDNSPTVALFEQAFSGVQKRRITYTFPLTETVLPSILAMSPLLWNIPAEKKVIKLQELPVITLDFLS